MGEKLLCPSCGKQFEPGFALCPYDGTKLILPSQDPLAGKVIDGRYRILFKIGEGGMGAVYKATQISTGKPVAIKTISKELSSDEGTIKRFQREVDIQSKLTHPNIVSLIDFSRMNGGDFFFVMEFVEGPSLRQRIIEKGRLSLEEFFDFAGQMLDGLAYAHHEGVVHRDLKGSNIIIAQAGQQQIVKILDFGLAKAVSGRRGKPGQRPYGDGADAGDAAVHVAGAGQGRGEKDRPGQRPVRGGGDFLRNAHGAPAVR